MKPTIFEISSIPRANSAITSIIADVEVASPNGRFPSVKEADTEVVCVTINISSDDKTLIYGCSVLSDTIKKAMPELNASYIKCENEKELLKKVLGHIYIAKPTHCIGEFTIPAIKYLNDRAAKLGVNVYDCTEDFNKWFSSYDNPIYSAIAATRPRKPSCPIAEHAAKMFAQRRAYKSMLVTQKKPYSAPIKVLEGSAV